MRSMSLRRPTLPVAIEPNRRTLRMAYFRNTGLASLVTSAGVMELLLVRLFIPGNLRKLFYRRGRRESRELESRDESKTVTSGKRRRKEALLLEFAIRRPSIRHSFQFKIRNSQFEIFFSQLSALNSRLNSVARLTEKL